MLVTNLTILVLAGFIGFAVISKIPNTLHTPLMSGTNAIHGIVLLGGLLIVGFAGNSAFNKVILVIAIAFGTINIVGGFLVTDRMLEMFKRKPTEAPKDGEHHCSLSLGGGGGSGLRLNISSMRSVTRKPPTMLIVPNAIAITRITLLKALLPDRPITNRPPSRTMPWIALVPLISGVWSVFGTFEITAKPTKPASTRIVRFVISTMQPPRVPWPSRRARRRA